MPGLDEPSHDCPVRELDAEDLDAGIGVSVEVNEAYGPVRGGAGAHVRLGDGVVPAEDDRYRTSREHLTHHLLYRRVGADGVSGNYRRVPEINHSQLGERVDLGLELRSGGAARGPDRTRRESRPGTV